jgi:FdhE protein
MALVALEPASRQSRLRAATARWHALLAARPDLEPAIALQKQLIGLVVDLADLVEQARLPRLSLPPKYLAAKLARGIPALAGEPIPLPVATLKPTLLRLCVELAEGGAGDAADRVRLSIEESRLDAGSLLAASLARDQNAIRTGANHRGLAPDLVWLVAELAVSPFAHALQRALLPVDAASIGAAEALDRALAGWTRGFCPACGSWPAVTEITPARRALRCSFCAFAWELSGVACIYCGEAGESLVVVAPENGPGDRRLELCQRCKSYAKTVDVAELSPFPLIAIADLETMELDLLAMQSGYSRPPLKEFRLKG